MNNEQKMDKDLSKRPLSIIANIIVELLFFFHPRYMLRLYHYERSDRSIILCIKKCFSSFHFGCNHIYSKKTCGAHAI
jgi:hypothetical protein